MYFHKLYKSIIAVVFSIVITSCGRSKPQEEQATQKEPGHISLNEVQIKNAGLEYTNAERKKIASLIKVHGKIEAPPQNLISVSIPLGGFLKSTRLMPGMPIRKGEVIAVMEDQQYIELQQNYLVSKEKLKYLTKEHERQQELIKTNATSEKVFQQTQSEFNSERVNARSLEEKLKLLGIDPAKINEHTISRSVNITSPINGYVSTVNGNIGKYVEPAFVLFELVNPEDIHLSLTIFEKDLDKIFLGQKVIAYTNHSPDKKYNCEVILIGKNLAVDRSVEIHCHFDQYDPSLIPGMYMNAEVESKGKEALVLPTEAVVDYENKKYVFKSEGQGKFLMKEVKTGISEHGYTELLSLSDSTSKYVTKGAYTLLMTLKNTSEE